jgi:hypothetical protein
MYDPIHFPYFVPLETGEPIFFDIGYFWSLYPTADCLLVTSTSMVACYDQEAHLLWESDKVRNLYGERHSL